MSDWLPKSLKASADTYYNRSSLKSKRDGLNPKQSVTGATQKQVSANTLDFFPKKRNQKSETHSDRSKTRNPNNVSKVNEQTKSSHSKSNYGQKPKRFVTDETDAKTASSSTLGSILDETDLESEKQLDRKSTQSRNVSRVDKDRTHTHNKDNEQPQKIIIETSVTTDVKNPNGGNSGNCLSFLTTKRIVIIVIIYAIIATGLWTYFFNLAWGLPGRQEQIKELEEQIQLLDKETDELEDQVDRLESQVTRLSNETDRLELINKDIKNTANGLNETVQRYEKINANISDSAEFYKQLNEELAESLNAAEAINDILGDSISALEAEVKSLSDLHIDLNKTVSDLENQNEVYYETVLDLQKANKQSTQQIGRLETELTNLEEQNKALDTANENLVSILTFMKQTGIDLNTTIEELTGYLGKEIDENSVLVLLSLEHSYQNVYTYWTTAGVFDNLFGWKEWMTSKDKPIGKDDYGQLMEYIDEHVISEVCANKEDFEKFLATDPVVGYNGSVPPVDISFRSLRSGVERYFSSLINYYFKFDGTGLSKLEWMEAEYDCKNIPVDRRFTWS